MWLADLTFNWSCYLKQVREFFGDHVSAILDQVNSGAGSNYIPDGFTC
jgi:hypothetical protein